MTFSQKMETIKRKTLAALHQVVCQVVFSLLLVVSLFRTLRRLCHWKSAECHCSTLVGCHGKQTCITFEGSVYKKIPSYKSLLCVAPKLLLPSFQHISLRTVSEK